MGFQLSTIPIFHGSMNSKQEIGKASSALGWADLLLEEISWLDLQMLQVPDRSLSTGATNFPHGGRQIG